MGFGEVGRGGLLQGVAATWPLGEVKVASTVGVSCQSAVRLNMCPLSSCFNTES